METREKLIQICGWIEITLSIVLNSGYVLSGARETEKHTKATSNIIQCELQLHWNYASVENNYSVIHAFIFLAGKDITQLFAGRHSWVERTCTLNIKQTEIRERCLACRKKVAQGRKRKMQQLIVYMLPYIKHIFWSQKVYRNNFTEMFKGCSAFLVPIRHSVFLSPPLGKVLSCAHFGASPETKPPLQNLPAHFQLLTLVRDFPTNLESHRSILIVEK